jgi:hypothetical protein
MIPAGPTLGSGFFTGIHGAATAWSRATSIGRQLKFIIYVNSGTTGARTIRSVSAKATAAACAVHVTRSVPQGANN